MVIPNHSPTIVQGTGTLNGSNKSCKFRVWLDVGGGGGSSIRIQIYTESRRMEVRPGIRDDANRLMLAQTVYYDSGINGEKFSSMGCLAVH